MSDLTPIGLHVLTFFAIPGENERGQWVTYTLLTENVPFAIDADTGGIVTTAPLKEPSYVLEVQATDSEFPPLDALTPANVTITVFPSGIFLQLREVAMLLVF